MTFGTDEISSGFRRPRQDCSGTRLMHSLTSIEHNVIMAIVIRIRNVIMMIIIVVTIRIVVVVIGILLKNKNHNRYNNNGRKMS